MAEMIDEQTFPDPVSDARALQETVHQAEVEFRSRIMHYRSLAEGGPESPRSILEHTAARQALEEAARDVLDARAAIQGLDEAIALRRRVEAARQLTASEDSLVTLVQSAEVQIEALLETLSSIIGASKIRYGARHTLDGRASRRLLAREALNGWLRWRFTALDIPDLRPRAHERHIGLAERLGVADRPSTDPASAVSPHDLKEPT